MVKHCLIDYIDGDSPTQLYAITEKGRRAYHEVIDFYRAKLKEDTE